MEIQLSEDGITFNELFKLIFTLLFCSMFILGSVFFCFYAYQEPIIFQNSAAVWGIPAMLIFVPFVNAALLSLAACFSLKLLSKFGWVRFKYVKIP